MLIALTASHSTGKSTLLNKLAQRYNFNVVKEIARSVAHRYGHTLNISRDHSFDSNELQLLIANKYDEIIGNCKSGNFIFDRNLIDVFSYTQIFYENNQVTLEVLNYVRSVLEKNISKYDLIIFLPLDQSVHKIVMDGDRLDDKAFQLQTHNFMLDTIKMYQNKINRLLVPNEIDFDKRDTEIFAYLDKFLE